MGQFESVAGKSKNKNPATEGQRGGVLGGFKEAIRNVAKCSNWLISKPSLCDDNHFARPRLRVIFAGGRLGS